MSVSENELLEKVTQFLGESGLPKAELLPVHGGRNNRVFAVVSSSGSSILKVFFSHELDVRNRFKSEVDFLEYAMIRSPLFVPKILKVDSVRKIVMYEKIEGTRLTSDGVTVGDVEQASKFFLQLDSGKNSEQAHKIGEAAEASFTLQAHLDSIQRRLDKLLNSRFESRIDEEALNWITGELQTLWKNLLASIQKSSAQRGLDLSAKIPDEDRCLSPSDFGFHNALRESSGRIRFMDFEYAGWDSPAKLVCDFFCQEAVPVPISLLPAFVDAVLAPIQSTEIHRSQIELLLPAYKLKWCLIALNVFVTVDQQRRQFSLPNQTLDEIKSDQLARARKIGREFQGLVAHLRPEN